MADFKDTIILRDKVSKTIIKISQGFEKFDKQIGKTSKLLERFEQRTANLKKVGEKMKKVGQGLTIGLTLPIIAAGGAAVKFASDYEEALNKVDVAFGSSSQTIKDWSKNSLTVMGLSKGEALDSAALYGDMATGMGLAQEQAAQMAMRLTQLGADLASFKNISNDMAQTALKSIFTGETESLKNLGVVMTQTNLEQFAMSKGIRKRIKDMSEAEKVNLRCNYVLEKTKNAHGDFERTGGDAANQMRVFQSSLKDLGETFGQYILPTFTKVLKAINGMLKAFAGFPEPVKKTIIVFGAILAAVGPLLVVGGQLVLFFAYLPKALIGAKIGFALLGKGIAGLKTVFISLLASPATGWVIGIAVAITAVILIIKNWGKIVNWLKGVWQKVGDFIGGIIQNISNWLNNLLDKLGVLAYLIPGLSAIKIGKDIASKIGNKGNTTNNNVTNTNNSNNTSVVNNVKNFFAGWGNPQKRQYTT